MKFRCITFRPFCITFQPFLIHNLSHFDQLKSYSKFLTVSMVRDVLFIKSAALRSQSQLLIILRWNPQCCLFKTCSTILCFHLGNIPKEALVTIFLNQFACDQLCMLITYLLGQNYFFLKTMEIINVYYFLFSFLSKFLAVSEKKVWAAEYSQPRCQKAPR